MTEGFSQTDSAREIGVEKATKFVKLTPLAIAVIEELIRKDSSPEQVFRFLSRTQYLQISYETIYQHILNANAEGGTAILPLCESFIRNAGNARVPLIIAAGYQTVSASMSDQLSWRPENGSVTKRSIPLSEKSTKKHYSAWLKGKLNSR